MPPKRVVSSPRRTGRSRRPAVAAAVENYANASDSDSEDFCVENAYDPDAHPRGFKYSPMLETLNRQVLTWKDKPLEMNDVRLHEMWLARKACNEFFEPGGAGERYIKWRKEKQLQDAQFRKVIRDRRRSGGMSIAIQPLVDAQQSPSAFEVREIPLTGDCWELVLDLMGLAARRKFATVSKACCRVVYSRVTDVELKFKTKRKFAEAYQWPLDTAWLGSMNSYLALPRCRRIWVDYGPSEECLLDGSIPIILDIRLEGAVYDVHYVGDTYTFPAFRSILRRSAFIVELKPRALVFDSFWLAASMITSEWDRIQALYRQRVLLKLPSSALGGVEDLVPTHFRLFDVPVIIEIDGISCFDKKFNPELVYPEGNKFRPDFSFSGGLLHFADDTWQELRMPGVYLSSIRVPSNGSHSNPALWAQNPDLERFVKNARNFYAAFKVHFGDPRNASAADIRKFAVCKPQPQVAFGQTVEQACMPFVE